MRLHALLSVGFNNFEATGERTIEHNTLLLILNSTPTLLGVQHCLIFTFYDMRDYLALGDGVRTHLRDLNFTTFHALRLQY